jgi:23S rRNA (uracil1939-C5)-methyltransferase
MDPPRKGADEGFLRSALKLSPKKIVYISCEPETLARDIKILSSRYDVMSVQPVDMFPQTHHVETVVCLSLKK